MNIDPIMFLLLHFIQDSCIQIGIRSEKQNNVHKPYAGDRIGDLCLGGMKMCRSRLPEALGSQTRGIVFLIRLNGIEQDMIGSANCL